MHSDTSLPVPIKITSGLPPARRRERRRPWPCRGCAYFVRSKSRKRLPRQHQRNRLVLQLRDDLPGFDHFVRVAGTEHNQIGHGAQRRQLLDRLMRRSIFSHADRIVRKMKIDGISISAASRMLARM
jgi:hypothetical protein